MIKHIVFCIWMALCCGVLLFTIYIYAPGPSSDAGILFAAVMTALTFPSGLLVSASIAMLSMHHQEHWLAPIEDLPPFMSFGFLWVIFCVLGYLQWFKVLPWLWVKIRAFLSQ